MTRLALPSVKGTVVIELTVNQAKALAWLLDDSVNDMDDRFYTQLLGEIDRAIWAIEERE